jgi:hypothetical protein
MNDVLKTEEKRYFEGKPGPGRPIGSVKKPWLTPQYWHDLLMEQWEDLDVKEKAQIAMKGFACVIPKSIGPTSPEESVEASESAFKMLKMLEEVSCGTVGQGETHRQSSALSVDQWKTCVQTETPTTPSV